MKINFINSLIYFNPISKNLNTFQNFSNFKLIKKIQILSISILTCFSLCMLVNQWMPITLTAIGFVLLPITPLFRFLVNFSKENEATEKNNPKVDANRKIPTSIIHLSPTSKNYGFEVNNKNSIVKGEDSLIKEEVSIVKEEDSLIKEEDSLIKEEVSIVKEEDSLIKEEDSLIKEEDSLIKEEVSIVKEEDSLIKEEVSIVKEEDSLIKEKMSVVIDKNSVVNAEDNVIYDKDSPATIKNPKVSKKTRFCYEALDQLLSKQNKERGTAVDDGDCFFDAFAKVLNKKFEKNYTCRDLRKIVYEKANNDRNTINFLDKLNWRSEIETRENYVEQIGWDAKEAKDREVYAIWGRPMCDGEILCRHFGVNLRVYEVGCIEETGKSLENSDNYFIGADDVYPHDQKFENEIEIALVPGHFVPVFDK
jgi:hypothetical protein